MIAKSAPSTIVLAESLGLSKGNAIDAARILVCAIVAALLSGGYALAKGGSMRSEDRYNPQHIESLPAEVGGAVMRQCGTPRALHEFAAYSDHERIVLHYEHFYVKGATFSATRPDACTKFGRYDCCEATTVQIDTGRLSWRDLLHFE